MFDFGNNNDEEMIDQFMNRLNRLTSTNPDDFDKPHEKWQAITRGCQQLITKIENYQAA